MQRPDRITITSFWLDWLLLPIMLGAAWLTLRWALTDFHLASNLGAQQTALPAWAVSIPLVISAAGWAILGLGSLIREEYWEHRIWCCILALWSLCCLVGAVLILLSFLRGGGGFGVAGILNLVGLALIALMLTLPALMEVPLQAKAVRFSRAWTVLLAVCVGCLLAGMLLGFPYNFPRFGLGIGVLSFFGLGALEISSSQPAFPWLPRLWDLELGQEEFLAGLPRSKVWRVEGLVKLLAAMGCGIILVILSLT